MLHRIGPLHWPVWSCACRKQKFLVRKACWKLFQYNTETRYIWFYNNVKTVVPTDDLEPCISRLVPIPPTICNHILNFIYLWADWSQLMVGCLKKISVLQAQLWDHLVFRTILVFLFSGMHTNHHSQAFFPIEMTSISSKSFDPE